MNFEKMNLQDNIQGNQILPFLNNLDNDKLLNQLLLYVYDDDFILMINELSSSILFYHKTIEKYFTNIKILLNKMENTSYSTAIEGNTSNLENSFKQFYSNAKLIFLKMKEYRSVKLKNINKYISSHISQNTNENKSGLTIIINNNNNQNTISNEKIIDSVSPKKKNPEQQRKVISNDNNIPFFK